MKKSEYQRMAEMERTYWWHIGRFKIIDSFMGLTTKGNKKNKILNVGCGTGGTIETLGRHGVLTNIDMSQEAINFMKERGYEGVLKVPESGRLPFKASTFNIVGAFDVLEHIEDDVAALREWSRVLKSDGHILITIPAYAWLWSSHDECLHHKRRYTRRLVRDTAEKAGLKVERSTYAFMSSFILTVGFRFVHKITGAKTDSQSSYVKLPGLVNSLLVYVLFIEAYLLKYIRFPFGTSVVAILKKK